jgi:hypothetical protein
MGEISTAGVLRLRATSAVARDTSVRRSAQDDDFVASFGEKHPKQVRAYVLDAIGILDGFISPSRDELGIGSQGSGGIDGGGPPRWNQPREGGREDDDRYGGGVDGRVYRRHIEELAAECSRGEDSDRDRNRDSDTGQG